MVDRNFYNMILSQAISPCGGYLLAGDVYGTIHVFNLQKIIESNSEVAEQKAKSKLAFSVGNDVEVCSLASTEKFLIVGTSGEISGWDWENIKSPKRVAKVSWSIQLPTSNESFESPDINCMCLDEANNRLFAGCGDNNIHICNLEYGKVVQTLSGHENYIHSLCLYKNTLASAGEDGAVKLWDLRDKNVEHNVLPHKNEKLTRPALGKWIGAASISEDWMVCGGGPRLSLWHLRSMALTSVCPTSDKGIHIAEFCDDKILAGGCCPLFYQLSLNGDIQAEIPCSATVLSIAHQDAPYKMLSLAGASPKIDFCTNFNYRDQVLTVE